MDQEIALSQEFEHIAQAMIETRGNIAKASRSTNITYNAMALREVVKNNPQIRNRYQELLADELSDKGVHIAERILRIAELQEEAFKGGTFIDINGNQEDVPPDVNTIINLSKELSRLIAEGKGQAMSAKATVMIASKEDVSELLERFLDS